MKPHSGDRFVPETPRRQKKTHQLIKSHFAEPGCYQIEVQGSISPKWRDRLGAMQVVEEDETSDMGLTVLRGCVVDQAELAGVLSTLHGLQLSLISIQFLGDEPKEKPGE